MFKLTPILLVDEIEPCLPFWIDRLGFLRVDEKEEDGQLAFIKLRRGNVELMYHTRSAVARDMPELAQAQVPGSTVLYIEVESLEEYERRLEGIRPIIGIRETSYGSAEIFLREPAGHIIAFAASSGY